MSATARKLCHQDQLSPSLLLLNSNEKVVEESSALYFWDHHTQPNPQKHWTLHLYIYH